MEELHYKVSVQELRERGYTFQKLFARNYKCYWKDLEATHSIWCWVAGKTIEIKDLYCRSKLVLDYFLRHKDNESMWFKGAMFPDYKYLHTRFNRKTGEIITREEIIEKVKPKTYEEMFNAVHKPVKDWEELVFHYDIWLGIADEVKFLTKSKEIT